MDPETSGLRSRLLSGCCYEAERGKRVAESLEELRRVIPSNLHAHLTGTIQEIYKTSYSLRDLADSLQVYVARVPVMIDYLNVILPCLSRTLVDIMEIYSDRSRSKERRWKAMYHILSNELPGTTLPARFVMYNGYVDMLQKLLSKSAMFDANGLESLRDRILLLREARSIPPPTSTRASLMWHDSMEYWEEETNEHWAESIFTRPLPSRTKLDKANRAVSVAYGPFKRLGELNISDNVRNLVKRSFNDDQISVTFFLQTISDTPYVLVRSSRDGSPWVSMLGAHELCIKRRHDAVLTFQRWSRNEHRSKPWAALAFLTWEDMVLFHCTFVCLKARSPLRVDLHPKEYAMLKENKLFKAQIIDDGFNHALFVYEDTYSGHHRLHAAVWDGVMADCPVWTAFLPTTPPKKWMLRKSRHRIWIRDIKPYVFCEKYRISRQRRPGHAYEIDFVKEEGATQFKKLFKPETSTVAIGDEDDSSDEGDSG